MIVALLRAAGVVIYRAGLAEWVIARRPRHVRVLVYHGCDDAENDFLRGLGANTPPVLFRDHLDYLTRHYAVVPLPLALRGDHPDRAVVLTFDDGLRSVARNALPILREHRASATVYLVTDVVDNRRLIWIHELNWLLRTHDRAVRRLAAERLRVAADASIGEMLRVAELRHDARETPALLVDLARAAGIDRERLAADAGLYVTWADVRELAAGGVTFGSHTASHPNLARLTEAEQRDELAASLRALVTHSGAVDSLAYPFGAFDAGARRVAREVGYASLMEAGGGNERLELPDVTRLSAEARSAAGLFADLEVVAPFLAWAKRQRRKRLREPSPANAPPDRATPLSAAGHRR